MLSDLIKNLDLSKFKLEFIKNEIKSLIRFKFNQIALLIEIIESFKNERKLQKYLTKYSSEYDV